MTMTVRTVSAVLSILSQLPGVWAGLLLSVSLLVCACRKREPAPSRAGVDTVLNLVASEELILALQPRVEELEKPMVAERSLPGAELRSTLFAPEVFLTDITEPSEAPVDGPLLTTSWAWIPASSSHRSSGNAWTMWQPLMDRIMRCERASWSIVRGEFTTAARDEFATDIALDALVWRGRKPVAVSAVAKAVWRRLTDGALAWRITSWTTEKLTVTEAPAPFFTEVFDRMSIVPAAAKERARRSLHHEIMMRGYFGGEKLDLPAGVRDSRFFPDAVNEHPGLAVVDIDRDGDDDLYILERWGPNLFLRNSGPDKNGLPRLEECAAELGLNVNGRSCAAVFIDLDNDGDPDCIVGRSMDTSLLLINDGGKFADRTAQLAPQGLPALVTSVSAADYNGDGLIDVYFSTYSPLDITTRLTGQDHQKGVVPEWARQFLLPAEQEEVVRRQAVAHEFLGQVGPPNVLMVNRGGGRLERAPESAALAGWRNTFQASWGDYDNDGDPDIYVANDFAPDIFYRNDGRNPDGSGVTFTDVTKDAGLDHFGFGMGAAWGDYDRDGRLDLYVSNMYSKAGRRITAQVPGLDERMKAAAEGNFLYHNAGGRFDLVSGNTPPAIPVARAGWSWGGQFADFDNDTFPDLYVSSGFYTAPKEVDVKVDL